MRLLSLEVENYRNIASASLTPGRELTVICGNNGQGKTHLLEAIWLLTGGKSFRGGKDAELVRRGEPFAVLKASTLRAQQEEQEKEEPNRVRLTVGAPDSPRPGRTVSVNGGAVKRAASLAGSFPAVVFDPGHLSLVKGAPEGRRKFLDAALCQLYPGYLTLYRRYVRALQQKNALLRRSSNGIERPYAEKRALLEVLNVELAQQGEAIQQRRRDYLAALSPLACANYEELSRGAETLSLRYARHHPRSGPGPPAVRRHPGALHGPDHRAGHGGGGHGAAPPPLYRRPDPFPAQPGHGAHTTPGPRTAGAHRLPLLPPLPQGHGALRPGGAGGGRAAHGREGEVLPL